MRNNHVTKLLAFISAFLMIAGIIALPAKTALAEDSQVSPTSALSSDCSLASLSVNDGAAAIDLLAGFDTNTNTYKASVGADTGSVTIEATATDPLAQVSGNTGSLSLTCGDNAFKVTVTAQDGTLKDYNITITRPEKPAPEQTPAPTETPVQTQDNKPGALCETGDDNTYGDFKYEIKDDTYIIITCYEGDGGDVNVPASINDKPVTQIGEDAFCGSCISSVTLPDSITDIGKSAFRSCWDLVSVTFGSGLKSIGEYAFECCGSIESFTLPASLETIGEGAFQGCGAIETLNIPSKVSSIGKMFVYGCESLDSITVDDGNEHYITQFDGMLFTHDIKTIVACPADYYDNEEDDYFSFEIPGTVETILPGAFADCVYIGSVSIPGSVSEIPESCFEDCYNIETVTLSEGLTKIDDYAFEGCGSLESITLPASLTSVNGLAFAGCCSLKEIKVADGSSYTSSDDGVLFSGGGKVLVAFPGGYWDEDSEACAKVMAKGKAGALCYEEYDNPYTIPSGVEEIGKGAFAECPITEITFDEDIKKIDDYAFSGCGALMMVEVPDSVTTIGKEAFGDCYALESATLGNGLTSISASAFECCESLMTVYFTGDKPDVDMDGCDEVFAGCKDLTLYYPAGKSGYTSPTWLGFPSATFNPDVQCNVTYDYNDGSGVTKTLKIFKGGKAVDLYPEGESDDSFLGWYKDAACTHPWYFDTEIITSNVTIYGEWATEKNAYLDELCLSDECGDDITLSPEFDSKIISYTASLGQDQDYFKVTAYPNYEDAKVLIDNKVQSCKEFDNIKPGQSRTFTVKVKTGILIMSYTVTVTKAISNDADLESLTAKSGETDLSFNENFDKDLLEYNLELNTSSVTINAKKDDTNAKVTIDGKSKASKKFKNINPGDKVTCVIKVTAQNKDVKQYTVYISRDMDTDANLLSLKTNLNKYGLNPKFSQDEDSYEVYLPENIGSVTLYAKPEGYMASMKITNVGTKETKTNGSIKVNLGYGESAEIDIEVTAQASTEDSPIVKDYTVMVYRASKITAFSALPKSGSTPSLSPGGSNKLTFNWTQAGDGTANIEVYADGEWQSIYSDDFGEGPQSYEWDGEVDGEYLDANKYKARISVSCENEDEDHTIVSSYKTITVKILSAPAITLSVLPGSITEGGDDSTNITVRWNVLTQVKVEIFDGGDLVKTLWDDDSYISSKVLTLNWDGTDDYDNAVDPGTYKIVVSAADVTTYKEITVTPDEEE